MPEKTDTKTEVKTEEKDLRQIVTKSVKHKFTQEEREQITTKMLNAFDVRDNAEKEFDALKATSKAKITEAESVIGTLRAQLNAGFDVRQADCYLTMIPDRKIKRFNLVDTGELVAEEPMSSDDFQQDLIRAESIFEHREEIVLFQSERDKGVLVIGRLNNRWFAALRMRVGTQELQERLDSEQSSFKKRWDAISRASKRANEWLAEQFKDDADGFKEPIKSAIEPQKEREE